MYKYKEIVFRRPSPKMFPSVDGIDRSADGGSYIAE